jgi:hypothetical protein
MQEIHEIGLVIHDLVGGNSHFIDKYMAIYEELFPQYLHYAPMMRQRAENSLDENAVEKWHQWLLIVKDQPVGLIGFLYNKNRNTGVLLDFAIKPDARNIRSRENLRFANLCLNLAMQELVQDAQAEGHAAPLCMVAEVEYPALLKRYKEYGYKEFPLEYFEPPYTPELLEVLGREKIFDKIDYQRMFVGAFEIPGHPFDLTAPGVIKTILFTLLEDHYHLPADHWLVKKMIQEIPA